MSAVTKDVIQRCSELAGKPVGPDMLMSHITGPIFGPGAQGLARFEALQDILQKDMGIKFDAKTFQNKIAVKDIAHYAEELVAAKNGVALPAAPAPVKAEHAHSFTEFVKEMGEELAPNQP